MLIIGIKHNSFIVYVMEANELKRQMMKLWKETFHDSDDYVNLVFDSYFAPEYVVYEESEGKVIAALLAVPYDFKFGIDSDALCGRLPECFLKGLYLCGLATDEKFRGMGIMSRLIDKINCVACEKGYDFTFLIPASEGLRKYYKDRGYVNSFYRCINRYTSAHDFRNDCFCSLKNDEKRYDELNVVSVRSLLEKSRVAYSGIDTNSSRECSDCFYKVVFMLSRILHIFEDKVVNDKCGMFIRHTEKDFYNIILDNYISGGDILISYKDNYLLSVVDYVVNGLCDYNKNSILSYDDIGLNCLNIDSDIVLGSITGCLFCMPREDCDDVFVSVVMNVDEQSKFRLLQSVKESYVNRGIVFSDFIKTSMDASLWSPYYFSSDVSGGSVDVFSPSSDVGCSSEFDNEVSSIKPGLMAAEQAKKALPYGMLRLVNPFSVLKTLSGISHHNKYSILLALEENWFLRLVRVNQMECKPYPFNSDSKCRVLRDFCVQNDRCEIEPQRVLKKSHLDSKPDFDNNPITESKNTEIGIGNGRLKDMVFVNVSFNDGVMSELNYEIASDNTYDKFVINNSNIFGGCKEPDIPVSINALSSILFSRPYRNDIVDGAISLPRVNIGIGLLLD